MNNFLHKHSSTMLSIVGSVGVIATAVLAVKATPKAYQIVLDDSQINHDGDPYAFTKTEAIRSAWKCYIPAGAAAFSTIVCILGANTMNKRTQASLVSAYSMLDRCFKDYKHRVESVYGEDAKNDIFESYTEKSNDVLEAYKIHSRDDLFYDYFSYRYFESTLPKLLEQEKEFNELYHKQGYATLNQFYDIVGLARVKGGDELGWSSGWNDVSFECLHQIVNIDDGPEDDISCYILVFPVEPTVDFR